MNSCVNTNENLPLISVVTVCYNSARSIAATIKSVNKQDYPSVEHVFIDGGSADNTLAIIDEFCTRTKIVVSEPDNGIYDAMNKGFVASSGGIICFLNSDDTFADDGVLTSVATCFKDAQCDLAYGDIRLVTNDGTLIRNWIVGEPAFSPQVLQPQIPHPGMFVATDLLRKISGPFDASMRISADLKLQLELIKVSSNKPHYLNRLVVNMLVGGASTGSFRAQFRGWVESARAWRDVHGGTGMLFVAQKVIRKLVQIKV